METAIIILEAVIIVLLGSLTAPVPQNTPKA